MAKGSELARIERRVRELLLPYVKRRLDSHGPRGKSKTGEFYGTTRQTVDSWLDQRKPKVPQLESIIAICEREGFDPADVLFDDVRSRLTSAEDLLREIFAHGLTKDLRTRAEQLLGPQPSPGYSAHLYPGGPAHVVDAGPPQTMTKGTRPAAHSKPKAHRVEYDERYSRMAEARAIAIRRGADPGFVARYELRLDFDGSPSAEQLANRIVRDHAIWSGKGDEGREATDDET